MIDAILTPIVAWMTAVLTDLSYFGVILLMAIESMNIPLPSEVILPFTGYLVSQGAMNFHLAALSGAVGCVVGSVFSYALGYFGGRPFLERYGKWLLIHEGDLNTSEKYFQKHGQLLFFVGRMLPVVRTFISLPAGILKVPFWPFIALTFLGSWIWSYALVAVGMNLGDHWEELSPVWHKFDVLIVLLAAIGFSLYIWRHVKKVRHRS